MVIDQIKSQLLHDNIPVVIQLDSGLDGLLTSRIESFDLVICGTDLPVITGFELVRSMRTNSVNKNVPVIFVVDKLDPKTEHLCNALRVRGTIQTSEVGTLLAGLVHGTVPSGQSTQWQNAV